MCIGQIWKNLWKTPEAAPKKARPKTQHSEPSTTEAKLIANCKPLLDLLGKTEGTDRGDGYNETLRYGHYTGGDVDLCNMTLAEIDDLQTRMLRHPDNYQNSSAVGRYQIIRTTLRRLKKKEGLPDSLKYDQRLQDLLAITLTKGRGLDKYISGSMREQTFVNNLAKEWASLPTIHGDGHYKGQNAAASVAKVKLVIREVRDNFTL